MPSAVLRTGHGVAALGGALAFGVSVVFLVGGLGLVTFAHITQAAGARVNGD